jgi:hypothetical protein
VPDVVQVDLGKIGRRSQLLEAPSDRVRMRRPAVLPAELHAVIVVVRPEVAPFLVELLDVHFQGDGAARRRSPAGRAAWRADPARRGGG